MRTVTLHEHATAPVGDAPGPLDFTTREVDALDQAQRAVGIDAFRWVSRTKIKATQYVGILAAADVRLEILPKIDGLGVGSTRRALVRMIIAASDVPVRDGEITAHDYQDRDLLELLIGLFARRLQEQVRTGLSREYHRREDDLSRLRGKLDLIRQFTKLAVSPQTLACQYDHFTADTRLNRLLLCAVTVLRRRSIRADTQRLLNEIAAHFEDVLPVSASEALATTLTFDRSNSRWEIPVTLARLVLSSIYQTTHGGSRDGIALLFDMNLLFESYVAALTRKICAPLGYKVRTQSPQRCLARNAASQNAFYTKPDVCIECDGEFIIVDTKWKHINPQKPNFDVSQADAYQMHGYAHVYRSRCAVLLYPHHAGIGAATGPQALWHFVSGGAALHVATIDVAQPDTFAETLRLLLGDATRRSAK